MSEFKYPPARRLHLTEDISGHQVSDPYRWLEDDPSAERAGWLSAQTDLLDSFRDELPGRDRLAGLRRQTYFGAAGRQARYLEAAQVVHKGGGR